jgi:hypothetical protein
VVGNVEYEIISKDVGVACVPESAWKTEGSHWIKHLQSQNWSGISRVHKISKSLANSKFWAPEKGHGTISVQSDHK